MPDRISLSAIKFVGFNFRSTTISANTTYIGANNIKDMPKCGEFIRVNRIHQNA